MGTKTFKTQSLPEYLKPYIVNQDYKKYTSRDHAVWRFIMRQACDFFLDYGHPSYLKGLKKTGLSIESIPKVTEVNKKLNEFGWQAVCVSGFIPPLAFLEFQSHSILPIAADIRTVDHLAYTPAPDIVHEAAGHAPLLADASYRDYLKKYSSVAKKAISSLEDIQLYEAIRKLSDFKENPDITSSQLREAELGLKEAYKGISWVSEAAKVSRMFWWTVEYGLVGTTEKPLIYGAGLLSSIGEARDCYKDNVKKIPFDLSCVEQNYDITEPQPQLYVTKDFNYLTTVLTELEKSLAFKVGGTSSLSLARKSKTVTTVQLETGLEISGTLENYEVLDNDALKFIKWSGPVQLSLGGKQIEGHGRERHPQGFSAPLGKWKSLNDEEEIHKIGDEEIKRLGLSQGKKIKIEFFSGIVLEGILNSFVIHPQTNAVLILCFSDCVVKSKNTIYFKPEWGEFDLALGSVAKSVYGGPADWAAYQGCDYGFAESHPGRKSKYTQNELIIFSQYEKIRTIRKDFKSKNITIEVITSLISSFLNDYSEEWLLGIEILELLKEVEMTQKQYYSQNIINRLRAIKDRDLGRYIDLGIKSAELKGFS